MVAKHVQDKNKHDKKACKAPVVLGLQCGVPLSHLANDNHQGLDAQGHSYFERGRGREAGIQVDPEHLSTKDGAPLAVTRHSDSK